VIGRAIEEKFNLCRTEITRETRVRQETLD
jgi:hypothetical protein